MSWLRSAGPSVAEVLGYDPKFLERVPAHLRRDLDALSQAWLVSCTLLGFPLGLAVWLVEHSLLLSFAVTLGVFALVLNLLRLLNAGSGTAPELALTKGYRPSLTPMIMLLGLALLMSQPAQLLHVSDSARQAVAVHRQQLLLSHRSALSELGQDGEDAFSKEIQECEFVVLRMQRLWDKPQLALLWTLLYVGIAMLPVALARTSYLKAVRAYERVRYRTLGRALRRLDAQAGVAVQAALVRYPSYRRPWPFAPERPLSVHDATPAQGALAVQEREA